MKERFQIMNGWLLVVIAIYCTVLYQLLAPGMFFDGLTYASVSENLASANSFWDLHYTQTLKYHFYEHPPLAFWLQYYFFQTGWNEEMYSLFTCLLSCLLIARIYILFSLEKSLNWLPVLFFITAPIVFWSFSNNMLENTLTVFILLNLHFILYIFKKNINVVWFTFTGMLTIICFLIKGPVGLVPLIFIPAYIYFFIPKSDWKKYYSSFYWYLTGFVISILILLSDQNAVDFFTHYFNEQVLDSVSGDRETANSRFFILGKLVLETAIMFALTLFFRFFGCKRDEFRISGFFIFLELCASLPILISAKQMGFYIVPLLALFGLGFSFLIGKNAFDFLRYWLVTFVLLLLIACSIPVWLISAVHDGRDQYHREITTTFKEELKVTDQIISISPKLKDDWALHAYLYRYLKISIQEGGEKDYYILNSGEMIPKGYKRIFMNRNFMIFVREELKLEQRNNKKLDY